MYDGANKSRRVGRTWRTRIGNSDKDDLPSLGTLRGLSRDAYRNQPIVKGGIDTKRYNVIGGGLVLQSKPNQRILGLSDQDASEWARLTEFEFSQVWGRNRACDAERTKTFGELQVVAFYSAMLSGDVCALLPNIPRGASYELSVKLVEADKLSNPNDGEDTAETAGGITVGEYGEPVTYHFSKNHPGGLDMTNEWIEVPAFGNETGRTNVIHVAERIRPDQRRGVPILAPVLESLKVLSEYTSAELEAALVSGLYTVFIKTEAGELPDPIGDQADAGDDDNLELAPGLVVGLKTGESIETANPGRPNAMFDGFVSSILKQVGSALQIPYELLMKNFNSSYSASRASLLEAWKSFKTRRVWFAEAFCDPIYEAWMTEAVASGKIQAPGFFDDERIRRAWLTCDWNGPQAGQLDPVKETASALARVEAGFSTRSKEASEMNGTDFEHNTIIAKRENEMMRESGLKIVDNSKMEKVDNDSENVTTEVIEVEEVEEKPKKDENE